MILERAAAIVTLTAMLLQGSFHAAVPEKNADGVLFLVNRQHPVTENYEPDTRRLNGSASSSQTLRGEAASALEEMLAAASEEGIKLSVVSGYRSYSKQAVIYARKKKTAGSTQKADRLVARPGTSEHQLGLAADLAKRGSSRLNEAFARTKEGQWVWQNCSRFGFIVRYPEDGEDITGYSFEPWHVRYVGKDAAASIAEKGEPMELWLSWYKSAVYDYLIFRSINEVWQ